MNEFNLSRCIELEWYAQSAYIRPNVVTPLAHWLVEDAGRYVVLAARGTASLRDAFSDLEAWPDQGLHAGFKRSYNQSIRPVLSALERFRDRPLYVTGHSLGGALAAIFCAENSERFDQCYTFGQPRVGDLAWSVMIQRLIGDRLFRVRDRNDIVPHLPFPPAFCHGGTDCFIDQGLKLHIGASILTTAWSDARGLWRAARHFDDVLVREHYLAQYETALKAIQESA